MPPSVLAAVLAGNRKGFGVVVSCFLKQCQNGWAWAVLSKNRWCCAASTVPDQPSWQSTCQRNSLKATMYLAAADLYRQECSSRSTNWCPILLIVVSLLLQHLLATFRTARVSSMSFDLNSQEPALQVTLKCDNGLIKRYGLDVTQSDILQANLDGQDLPVSVVADSGELTKLLNTFQSTLDEITIIALPELLQQSTAGAATAAQRAVKIQSFYDPAKGVSGQCLHTLLQLDSHSVFKSYSHSGSSASDVTINLKDLKALVGLCGELGVDVQLKFDAPGVPLLAVPHMTGVQAMDYTAELILATLQESQVNDDDEGWPADEQQQAAAAAAHGATGNSGTPLHHQQLQQQQGAYMANGAAADRAETIAAATTFVDGEGGGRGGGAAGDITPQGGVQGMQQERSDPGMIQFNAPATWQQQQLSAAHAAPPGDNSHLADSGAAGSGHFTAAAGIGSGGCGGAGGFSVAAGSGAAGGRRRFNNRGSEMSGLDKLQRLDAQATTATGAQGPSRIAPYSSLASSAGAAQRPCGGAESAGGPAASGGGDVSYGNRTPIDAAGNQTGGTVNYYSPQLQQQQQPGSGVGYAGGSNALQWQQSHAAGGSAAPAYGRRSAQNVSGGLDSQAEDPEALPGQRQHVARLFQGQQYQQQQAGLQGYQQKGQQEQQQERQQEQQQQPQQNEDIYGQGADARGWQQQEEDAAMQTGDEEGESDELPQTPADGDGQQAGTGLGFL